ARVWRGKRLVLLRLTIFEVVRTAEIIFRACAADGGKLPVAIQVKLDLAFAPPPRAVDFPGQISADVLALTLDLIQNVVDALLREWPLAAELRVKVARIIGHIGQRIVYLVIKHYIFGVGILHRDPG